MINNLATKLQKTFEISAEINIFVPQNSKKSMKITKNTYLKGFSCIVLALALVRCIFPSVTRQSLSDARTSDSDSIILAKADSARKILQIQKEKDLEEVERKVEIAQEKNSVRNMKASAGDTSQRVSSNNVAQSAVEIKSLKYFNPDGSLVRHRIYSVPSYRDAFPDMQDVQITAANKYGVSPVQNRADAESRKMELVYIGANPYFFVDPLRNSIPYLVPRASVLLEDIGRNFFDSLQIKGVPLHKIIVTSVLRSKDDVLRLRGHNGNATENSCHLYGTTFDICYNRYKTVSDPQGQQRRQVSNDTLKWVLSEVLRDMRDHRRCYVKYEVKQGCFHITTR